MTQVQGDLNKISGQAQGAAREPERRHRAGESRTDRAASEAGEQPDREQSPKLDKITDEVLLRAAMPTRRSKRSAHLLDQTNTTMANVNTTVDQLREPIRQDLAQLQSTMEQAKSLLAGLQTVVRGNDSNLSATIENLRIATENLDQLTDQ
ncbi:MAG: hypothetical protein WDO73_30910 [Ignavibacteriota bacterium]